MPQYGMTVTPEYDGDGNYVSSNISGHPNDSTVDHSGRVRGWESDYYENSKGETHHHFSETELTEERKSATDFDIDAYQVALTEAYPGLEAAIRWVENAPEFTDEDLQAYNKAFDNQDLTAMHEFYERLLPAFYAAQQQDAQPVEEEETSYDELSDNDYYDTLNEQGVIDETFAELSDPEYQLTDSQVEQLDTVMNVFDEDTVEHEIANVGIAMSNGEIDFEEALSILTAQYSDGQIARAYYKLNSILG